MIFLVVRDSYIEVNSGAGYQFWLMGLRALVQGAFSRVRKNVREICERCEKYTG